MKQKTDPIAIREAFQRINIHPLFANSSIYSRLLEYLVEKALNNEEVKEFTIGADLFKKNYLSDKNDGTVRTHMYNLRKKLAEYYLKEGAEENLRFTISKGQYNLDFVTKEKKSEEQAINNPTLTIAIKHLKLVGIAILIVVALFWAVWSYLNQTPLLWEDFFKPNQNNLVVVSDQYVVHEKLSDEKIHTVLYEEINNNEDFISYTNKLPDTKIKITDYTLMTKMAPYCLKNITEWFVNHKSNFELKLESNLNYEEIRNANVLFIGQFKTMNISKSFFLKNSRVFSIYHDGFKYKKNGVEKIYDTQYDKNNKLEYAMVAYTSLVPGKKAFYFVSNNDIGVMATLSKFTDENWLKEFQSKLGGKKKHFNALFKVSGLQRTELSCKMVALELIE